MSRPTHRRASLACVVPLLAAAGLAISGCVTHHQPSPPETPAAGRATLDAAAEPPPVPEEFRRRERVPPMDPALPASAQIVIASPAERAPGTAGRPPFKFSAQDEALLDEIQRKCFNYFWEAVVPETGMVPDRSSITTISVAGVGFQLSAICIGVERGWITRAQGQERVLKILRALRDNPDNRHNGLFYHFVDGKTAGQPSKAYEHVVSTIDTALLFAGILTTSSYFGGEVASIGDALVAEGNWAWLVIGDRHDPSRPWDANFLSLAWIPDDITKPRGSGKLKPFAWIDTGDEHKLITFFAIAAPRKDFSIPAKTYYQLRRPVGRFAGAGTLGPVGAPAAPSADPQRDLMVHLPFSGAMFIHFFAHCWIDYAAMGPDDPSAVGVSNRARVDWWENSVRQTRLHQLKVAANPRGYKDFADHGWGLTAGDNAKGYQVPGVYPDSLALKGDRVGWDTVAYIPDDDFGDGTIAPYGAGSTIMFDPARALAAMRWARNYRAPDGKLMSWKEPGAPGTQISGGFGLSSFNPTTGWSAPEYIAIDHGPMMLAIENARTGLVWRLFHQHPIAKEGLNRLGLRRQR